MKRILAVCMILLLFCSGCSLPEANSDIAATTLPVYQFSTILCQGTGLTVTRLVTESVSCLHDYTLSVRQVKAAQSADVIVISGAGLEVFMEDVLENKPVIDASEGISLLESCDHPDHGHPEDHHHDEDPHIWLSPANAMEMAENICRGLKAQYPAHAQIFDQNLQQLQSQLQQLLDYGRQQLSALQSREMITFHDGFGYFANCFDLQILAAVEEEAGSETSSRKLIELIELTRKHGLRAVFTETNGSHASARVIAAETEAAVFCLDMAMAGEDYFAAMYHNIDVIREALG